jgi:hypothetical protein
VRILPPSNPSPPRPTYVAHPRTRTSAPWPASTDWTLSALPDAAGCGVPTCSAATRGMGNHCSPRLLARGMWDSQPRRLTGFASIQFPSRWGDRPSLPCVQSSPKAACLWGSRFLNPV